MDKLEQVKNTVTTNGMWEWADKRVGQVMQEYADQQNEELRERVKELEAKQTVVDETFGLMMYAFDFIERRVDELDSELDEISHHCKLLTGADYWKMRAISAEKLIEMEPSDPKTYDEFCRLRDEWHELKNQEAPPY